MAMAAERQAPAADDVGSENDEEELFARPKTAPKEPAVNDDDKPLTAKERREFKQRIKDLEDRAAERGRETDFWAARARERPTVVTRETPAKVDEPEYDDVTAMEEFSKSPLTAFAKMAKKYGYVTKAEQEANLQEALGNFGKVIMQRIQVDNALLREFPDLADSKSPFAKRTMEHLEELTEGDARKRNSFFKAAAKLAKADFELEKGRKRRVRASDDDEEDEMESDELDLGQDDDDEETAAERRSRINRQGPRGSGRTARALPSDYGSSSVMQNIFDQFDIKPERRAELAKKVKVARRSAIAEGM